MYYFLAIPIAILLYWSIHHLGTKYIGREPSWFKVYALFAFAYIVLTPVGLVNFLSQAAGLPGSTAAILMAIAGFLVFFLAIKFFPKQNVKQGTEWN